MFYLIEKYWYDSFENRNADGWKAYKVAHDIQDAIEWCENEDHFISVYESPWPLQHASHKKDNKVAMYRWKEIGEL